MSGVQKLGLTFACAAMFFGARLIHRAVTTRTIAAPASERAAREAAATASPSARQLPNVAPLANALGAAVAQMPRANPSFTREVMNTAREPEAHSQARRQYLTREMDRLYPSLLPSKRDALVAINDRSEAETRRQRAAFMLDQITEDEYAAALKRRFREGVEEAKRVLTREEFEVLEGNPDYDPFDPRAHSVPGRPPYVSPSEQQAIAANGGVIGARAR